MAQNEGKKFEEDWKKSFDNINAYFFRIKDSAASWSGGNSSFTRSNPYDCFVLYEGFFFAMELKSTQSTSVSFEKESKSHSGKMIKKHQIEELEKVKRYKDVFAGFIFNFRETRNTYYMDINDFVDFYNSTSKTSINENDIVDNNGILVDSKLLKVRSRYDIKKLLSTLINEK